MSDLVTVGIVASAGGLAALGKLLGTVPADSPCAFIVVQHLAPTTESALPELLAHLTPLTVQAARHGTRVQPGHVYVISPGTRLSLVAGALDVTRHEPASDSPLVGDYLLESLALEARERAVGIVLSGGGHDGTLGLRAIRQGGGLSIAQLPDTADHRSMPESAIASGDAQLVLAPEQMYEQAVAHVGGEARVEQTQEPRAILATTLADICAVVHRRTGHDFSRYKSGTLQRRIRRRMHTLGLPTPQSYVAALEISDGEAELLLRELLIGVTQFFRDKEVFEVLATQVIPSLVDSAEASLRVWVPGCASGEEAYSIAMLVIEEQTRRGDQRPAHIFATDIDAEAIRAARAGRYGADAMEGVSEVRRSRFFSRHGEIYMVTKELRDLCIFSTQDLVRDPPFSSLDLISCRNVLIYLQPDLQAKLLPIFHYALRPEGLLLLGPSEGLSASLDLFDPIDRAKRIFRRREVSAPPVDFSFRTRRTVAGALSATGESQRVPSWSSVQALGHAFQRTILEEYAPAGAAVDLRGNVLNVVGRLNRYLQSPAGVPSNNLFDQLIGPLRNAARSLVDEAYRRKRRVVRDSVLVESDDAGTLLRLIVWPLNAGQADLPACGLVIQPLGAVALPDAADVIADDETPVVEQLEKDLRLTRAELQSTIEELESANEELQSSNEELQSANEELHTSQEELQSVNEELETVNAELQTKVREVNAVNTDLRNLFVSTPVATIFLDAQLQITRFTPSARQLFQFIDADVGRPITHLAQRFSGLDYARDAAQVLARGNAVEHEVRSLDGTRCYVVRSQSFQDAGGANVGVVSTFVDVTELKSAEDAVLLRSELLQLSFDAILVWRIDGAIELWNRGATELYGFAETEALGRLSQELLQTRFPEPQAHVFEQLRAQGRWSGVLVHQARDGRELAVSAKWLLIRGTDGVERVFETNRDITERQQTERELSESEARLRLANETAGIAAFELELSSGRLTWYSRPVVLGGVEPPATLESLLTTVKSEDGARLLRAIRAACLQSTSPRIREELQLATIERWGLVIAQLVEEPRDGQRGSERMRGVWMDITARKQSERALAVTDRLQALGVLAGGIAHDFNNLLLGVYGNLELARGVSKDHQVHEYLEQALATHARAAALTNQLLTFAKGGAPRKGSGDLARIARRAVQFALTGSNVSARFDFEPEPMTCAFDANQVSRVFENLTINARQAMPQGGVVDVLGRELMIAPSGKLGLSPGRYYCVAVRDEGSGIPVAAQAHIFDPFFTTKEQGSGLGLATAHSILRQHDGAIDVESTAGRGSTFFVYLPVEDHASVDPAVEQQRVTKLQGRVLLMDDQAPVREVLGEMLRRLGCEVTLVAHGAEAVEAVRREAEAGRRFDALLLDLTVPGGRSGHDIVKDVRAFDEHVPLIAISGYSGDPIMSLPEEHGFALGLTKPMLSAELARALAPILGLKDV